VQKIKRPHPFFLADRNDGRGWGMDIQKASKRKTQNESVNLIWKGTKIREDATAAKKKRRKRKTSEYNEERLQLHGSWFWG